MTRLELVDEVAKLHRFALALSDRIFAAHEVLGRLAERKMKKPRMDAVRARRGRFGAGCFVRRRQLEQSSALPASPRPS